MPSAAVESWVEKDTHFANEPILVHGSSFFSRSIPWGLCPHLLDIFQYHIAMAIESLDSCQ